MPLLISRQESPEQVTFTYREEGQTGDTIITVYKTDPPSWKVQYPEEVQPNNWQAVVAQMDAALGVE